MQDLNKAVGSPDAMEPFKSRVRIEIQMNGYVFIFGVPVMLTLIILGSMLVLYLVGGLKGNKDYQASQAAGFRGDEVVARVLERMPEFAKAFEPKVTVNVPNSPLPENRIMLPEMHPRIIVQNAPSEAPNVNVSITGGGDNKPQTITKVVEKIVEREVPVYVETADKAVILISDLYPFAEQFILDWCKKNSLDPKLEEKRWIEQWNSRVKEDGDEQRLANRVLIEKRDGFNVEKARTEQIVEVCRLMLRYRDARLAFPPLFKEHISAANLVKVKRFLENGSALAPTLVKSQ